MISRAPRRVRGTLAPLVLRLRLGLVASQAVAGLGLVSACAPDSGPAVEVVETVYFEDAHESAINVELGERFAIALPKVTKVAGIVQRAPRRPRLDGNILTLRDMGAIPKAWVEQAGGQGTAYVIEAIKAGRTKVVIFDAVHRDRFVLNVTAGEPPAEPGKGRVRDGAKEPRFDHQRVPPVPPDARPRRDDAGKPLAPQKATLTPQLRPAK